MDPLSLLYLPFVTATLLVAIPNEFSHTIGCLLLFTRQRRRRRCLALIVIR